MRLRTTAVSNLGISVIEFPLKNTLSLQIANITNLQKALLRSVGAKKAALRYNLSSPSKL